MTERNRLIHKNELLTLLVSTLFLGIVLSSAIFLSSALSDMVRRSYSFAVSTVIPAIFPFILLTDFAVCFIRFERIEPIRRGFERVFKINGCALGAFVAGAIGGFPIGVHRACALYKDGKISKEECERLSGIANNASPAYTVCAVGIGIFGSVRIGVILYFIALISAVSAGMIFGRNKKYMQNTSVNSEQKYSFVSSVKSSAAICINACAFICAFSLITGVVNLLLNGSFVCCLILPFIEIGNAVLYISSAEGLSLTLRLALTAFALSFSGLCVVAQSAALAAEAGVSMSAYLKCKLTAGMISVILSLFVFSVC